MTATHASATTSATTYVQTHLPLLNAYSSGRRFRPWFTESSDYLGDLVASVLRSHHAFRPQPGAMVCDHCGEAGCSTWIGWRARAVRTDLIRARTRESREQQENPLVPLDEALALPNFADGSHRRMQAQAQLQQLMDRATPDQRVALVSRLEEWTGDEVWERMGISIHGRNYRLQRLAQSLDT